MENPIETCDTCNFPIYINDVDENNYETSRACSCVEDDLLVDRYNAEQAKKTDEEIKREDAEWEQGAKYIMKNGISPNLDSIY